MGDLLSVFAVAPLVGARVEIAEMKSTNDYKDVAPLVGARVEIPDTQLIPLDDGGRSPRGSAG